MAETVLLVSGSEKTTNTLTGLLKTDRSVRLSAAASGAEARRRMLQESWDLVLVGTPLGDELGDELGYLLAEKGAAVILIVKGEQAEELAAKVEGSGILVLPTPLSRSMLFQTLRLARVTHRQLAELRGQNQKLQKRLEEQRLVCRAKCALIQYRDYTEPQAHRFIEQEAMDRRITKKQVSEEIVRTFEG